MIALLIIVGISVALVIFLDKSTQPFSKVAHIGGIAAILWIMVEFGKALLALSPPGR